MQDVSLWKFNSKFELSTFLHFKFERSTTICIKGIRVRCTKFIILLSILKEGVDMN